jgi:hypothetical protein
MTRAERAAEKVQKEKAKQAALEVEHKARVAAQREETRQAEAVLREETRKASNKRRYRVGALADEAGLLAWSDSDLQAIFGLLAALGPCPNPVAVLESLLHEVVGTGGWQPCRLKIQSA